MVLVFDFKFCLFGSGLLILGISGNLVVWVILLDFGFGWFVWVVYGRVLVGLMIQVFLV